MPQSFSAASVYIVDALTSLYLLVLLLRFWMPWLRADFRNPLAQGILKLTSPLVIPARRIMPSFGKLDTATIVVAFIIQYLTVVLTLTIFGASMDFAAIAVTAIVKLAALSANLFMFAIFIRIILSWIAPGQYNSITALIMTLTEPLLRPLRRVLPTLGGFDISPIIAIIALRALTIIIYGIRL